MPYKTGTWGEQAKKRSKERCVYRKLYNQSRKNGIRKVVQTFGLLGEKVALDILQGATLGSKLRNQSNQVDIQWKDKNVEVKSSNLHKFKGNVNKSWCFSFKKKQKILNDYFLLLCFNNGVLLKSILIPSNEITQDSTITFLEDSKKYDKFLI